MKEHTANYIRDPSTMYVIYVDQGELGSLDLEGVGMFLVPGVC